MEPQETGLVSFEQVMAVEMKVATITEACPIDGADKLLKLQVDLGDEQRQIVAGIAQHYGCETLIGKRVVVVVNLKQPNYAVCVQKECYWPHPVKIVDIGYGGK